MNSEEVERENPHNIIEGDVVRFIDKGRGSKYDNPEVERVGVAKNIKDEPDPFDETELQVDCEIDEHRKFKPSIKFEDIIEVVERGSA